MIWIFSTAEISFCLFIFEPWDLIIFLKAFYTAERKTVESIPKTTTTVQPSPIHCLRRRRAEHIFTYFSNKIKTTYLKILFEIKFFSF